VAEASVQAADRQEFLVCAALDDAAALSLLDHRANVMSEILAGRLRCVNPNDSHRVRSDEVHAIGALLGLAPVPVQPL
jgi:hypothetical protein